MHLSIEQQKLHDALMPFTGNGGSMSFIVMQLIDRYWQPKPIDPRAGYWISRCSGCKKTKELVCETSWCDECLAQGSHSPSHKQSEAEDSMASSPIMKYFSYKHLPPHLQGISEHICELAIKMDAELPDGPEKSAGLRKLLEAKDCFVRTLV